MDLSSIIWGCIPFIIYLLILMGIRMYFHPVWIMGLWDNYILAFGLIGFIFTGFGRVIIPINVFMVWGNFAWGLLAILYFSLISFFTSRSRPFWVGYNCGKNEFCALLSRLSVLQGFEFQAHGPLWEIMFSTQEKEKEIHHTIYLIEEETPLFRNITIKLINRNYTLLEVQKIQAIFMN